MRRGEVWTVAGGGEFLTKPRPAVILQNDIYDDLSTISVCLLTTRHGEGPPIRIPLEPSARNGLESPSRLMVDRILTVRKSRLGIKVGELEDEQMERLSDAVTIFLDL